MAALNLENLLILQDRDMKCLRLEQQLQAIPHEVAALEEKIASGQQKIQTAKAEWLELETKKKSLENDIKEAEGKVEKYKIQQLLVRKNDEYQALIHEIQTMIAKIGDLEEAEIKVMFSIDEAKHRFVTAEAVLKANIAGHEEKIRVLRTRDTNTREELKAAKTEVTAARRVVPDDWFRPYERLAKYPGFPVCVPIRSGWCGGCHMKVSSSIEFEAYRSENITTCDQCGRIVHWAK